MASFSINEQSEIKWINPQLNELIIPNGVVGITKSASFFNRIKRIVIPETFERFDPFFFRRSCLEFISVDEKNPFFAVVDGVLYNKGLTSLLYMPSNYGFRKIVNGVRRIEDYAFCDTTSLEIPSSVEEISINAFERCHRLREINVDISNPFFSSVEGLLYNKNATKLIRFPEDSDIIGLTNETIIEIGEKAFGGCKKFESLLCPKLSILGKDAFYGCSSLTKVIIPNTVHEIPEGTFSECKQLKELLIPDSISFIGESAFSGCKSLHEITLPEGVDIIPNYLFAGCKSLDSLVIPSKVVSIGVKAFSDCSSLNELLLPKTVESIGDEAFSSCSSLSCIDIGNVSSLGHNCFSACHNLKSIIVGPKSSYVVSFDDGALYSRDLKQLIKVPQALFSGYDSSKENARHLLVPNSVKEIAAYAVEGCKYISSITLPEQLDCIHEGTFSGCSSLSEIDIPRRVRFIGKNAFRQCTSIEQVDIPDSVLEVGEYAFDGCSKLKSIDIPGSVSKIGSYAFRGCSDLQYVVLPQSISSINDYLFSNCLLLKKVDIPSAVSEIGEGAFCGCVSLRSIQLPSRLAVLSHNAFGSCSSLETISIPEGVNSVSSCAFDNCSKLKTVIFPDKLKSIGNRAFNGCKSLETIEFPETLESIDSFAFHDAGLIKVFITRNVKSIGEHAFCNCPIEEYSVDLDNPLYFSRDNVLYERINDNDIRLLKCSTSNPGPEFEVPDDVVEIGACAFKGCSQYENIVFNNKVSSFGEQQTFAKCNSLSTFIIPRQIASIPRLCFAKCSSLKSLVIPDRESLWIEEEAFSGCENLHEIHIGLRDLTGVIVFPDAFQDAIYETCILYVPAGTRWMYRHHEDFGAFKLIEIDGMTLDS